MWADLARLNEREGGQAHLREAAMLYERMGKPDQAVRCYGTLKLPKEILRIRLWEVHQVRQRLRDGGKRWWGWIGRRKGEKVGCRVGWLAGLSVWLPHVCGYDRMLADDLLMWVMLLFLAMRSCCSATVP